MIHQSHKISTLLITYNEYNNLEKLLPKLCFTDEIIIVDSFSDDRSQELVSQFPKVQFVQRKFDDFSSQRNYALSLAKNEWILFLDADEGLPDQLIEEIKQIIGSIEKSYDAYYVYRKNHFMKKHLRYSGWQNDKIIRLFKKSKCFYKGYVHEQLQVNGTIGILKTRIEHFTYKSFDHYVYKLHQYADLRAKELYNRKVNPNVYHYFFKPAYRFFNSYFIRLGFLDGYEGLINGITQSYGVFLRYVKLREMKQKQSNT
ncbi:MAG: glycosyltransferase family 2 protein [Flavobacteriales bacterium]